MPEYLAPGVYVEETSFRAKSIEGVGTSTTAFVGPTRKGPFRRGLDHQETPEILTSYGDFERLYGGHADLVHADGTRHTNHIAHAVLAYFNEGGSRLYVSRVVSRPDIDADAEPDEIDAAMGVATAAVGEGVAFRARFPGSAGNGRITVREVAAPVAEPVLARAPLGSLLRTGEEEDDYAFHIRTEAGWTTLGAAEGGGGDDDDDDEGEGGGAPAAVDLSDFPHLISLAVLATDAEGAELGWEDLGFDRSHPRFIGNVMAANPSRRADHLQNLFAITVGAAVDAEALRDALFDGADEDGDGGRVRTWRLTGGHDGAQPSDADYRLALGEIAALEDVSIVAAPGSSAYVDGRAIAGSLIAHAEARRAYRIAVLDTPPGQTPGQVREMRGQMDSRHAALYYPWVVVANPNARPGREDIPREIALPPSGYVCGIYARNDIQRGVHKAPANEVVRSALRFELDVNFGQQEVLNPIGVNCLRLLSGRGYRVWGARLISSDPEWKYVSDRRYFNYLESSIDRGTQWAVFEPNGERLWANVRQTISDFLYNEWRNDALLGGTPDEAFFVRCDRSTMTQNDLDNGRLVCLIGVAILKPAEFVIFRIGQKTADARS